MDLTFIFLFFLSRSCVQSYTDNHQSSYYQQWCSENGETDGYCEYLDDKYCQKVFPSKLYRSFMCPNVYTNDNITAAGYKPTSDFNGITVDETALTPYTSDDFYITAILIRRNSSHHPFYKYVSNGNNAKVYETWSSSKVYAIMNAASSMRQTCDKSYDIGLNANEKNTKYPLGDLITIVHSYHSDSPNANNPDYESNCLAYYFLNIGGRKQLDDDVHSGTVST